MVAYDEMALRERRYALWDSVFVAGQTKLLYNFTSITGILVTGVRKRLCDTCRKLKFPFGAVCILF